MATIAEQLTQLTSDRNSLVANLVTKGVTATTEETFTTLVPKVLDISGGITPSGTISITTNGTHDVTNYASANVNVPSESGTYQQKTITENGTYTADSGYDALSQVIVNVSGGGSNMTTGTFTLESDVPAYLTGSEDYRFIIEHGMSVTPNAVLIYPESNLVVTEDGYLTSGSFAVTFKMQNIGNVGRTYNNTGGVSGVSNYNTLVSDWNYVELTSSQILFGSNSSGTIIRAGCIYRWIAWVIPTNEE